MEEFTFEEFCALPVVYHMGMRYDWGAHRLHRMERVGLQIETITKQRIKGDIYSGWKPQERFYYLDEDYKRGMQHCYNTIDQAYVSYMEYACGMKGEIK